RSVDHLHLHSFPTRRSSDLEDVFSLAMTAFAHEIDPHTNYLSPRNTEQFNTEMSLSLEGIGAVLQMDDDYTVINSMVAGGPASRSEEHTSELQSRENLVCRL